MYCFASICRICLTSNKTDLINLNKSDTDNIKITDKLTFCIPEIFNPYNNLPENICGDCCQFIHRMYEFKQLCIDNTIILNKYASKLSSVPGIFEKNDLTIKITKDPKIEELLGSSSVVITDDESDSSVEFIEDQYELELDVIPNLEEQSTSCQLKEQTTSCHLKEQTTSDQLEVETSPKLKIQTSPKLKIQTSPQLKLQTSPQLEIQTSPQLVIQTSPKLEIKTIPLLEIQTSPKFDLQPTSPLETAPSPQLETLVSPKLETPSSPKLETSSSPQLEIPSSPQLEIPSSPELEAQSSPRSEENPQLEIKTSPQSEKQTSPQPVTLNNSPCSSNQPNSLSAPTTSNEISMYSVSLNKWDLFETKYTCRCIKEFSSFTENTTHLCKNCEGELLGFRLSKIKVGAAENRYSTNFPTIKQEEVEHSDSYESDVSDFETNEPNEYESERGFDYNDVLLCKVHINGVKKQINNLEDNLNHSEPNTGKYKVKQNTCPICEKTFPTRHFLNNHYLLHSGTKLLECDHCDEKYVDKNYLENHKLNHYRITKQKNNPSIKFEYDTPTTSKSVNFSDSDSEEEDHNVSKSSKNSDLNSSGEIAACGTCDKIFDSKSKLAIHLMTHFGKKDYKCPTCHKEFFRKENFDIHMNTHHIMPPVTQSIVLKYRCPHCLKIYNNISNVRRHIRETHEIKTYCCLICDEVFNDKEILQQHALVEHTADDGIQRKKFMCPNCDKNYPTLSSVRRHMGEVHGMQRFVCLICDVVFSNKQILDDHVFDEHTVSLNEFNEEIHKPKKSKSIDIKKFQCPHCEKCYNHKSNVQRHMKEKHETVKVENMITSDDDDADDEQHEYEEQHQYEEEHQYEEDPEYEEEDPEYEEDAEYEDPDYNEDSDYKEEPEFDEYEEDEDEEEEEEDEYKTKDYEMKLNDNKQYTCHYCERPFQNVRSLRQHVRDGHGKVEYFCTICNAIFNEKQTLDEHIFVVHNLMNSDDDTEQETKPHSQEIKPHAQDRKSSHAQERKSHTQERKSHAQETKSSHTQETKPFHIEAKKFECSLCDKRYFHLSAVRRHMRDSHSVVNVDKYLCSICNKTFVDKRILEEHIFSVHTQTENKNTTTDEDKQKGFSCPVCHKRFLHLSNLRMHALSHTDVQEPSSYNYCKICKIAIKKNTSMTKHMRTHKRAKIYDCTACTDKFDNRWVLTQHMKTKHPDFKPNFECKVCSKTYTTKFTFLKHRQTHTQ